MAHLPGSDKDEEKDQPSEAVPSGMLGGYLQMQAQPLPLQNPHVYGTGGSAPTATGHVNFDRIYAANEGTAQRDAARMGQSAQGAATKAQQGLGSLQQQFSSQSKAAEGVPAQQAWKDWAAHASTGVDHGKQVKDAYFTPSGQANWGGGPKPAASGIPVSGFGVGGLQTLNAGQKAIADQTGAPTTGTEPPQQSYVTEEQEGLTSGESVTRDASGNVTGVEQHPGMDPATEAAVRAAAAGKYTGPGSLQDMAGYKGLLGDYEGAQRQLSGLQDDAHIQGALDETNKGPYIEGGNRLDAALIGQAGRPDFANLEQKYAGLGGELGAANKASFAQGDASRAAAEANAKESQGLLDQYLGRQSADQQAEDASQAKSDSIVSGAQQHAQNVHDFDYAMNSGTVFDKFRNGLHQVARFLSPVDAGFHAAGQKAPVEYGTDYLGSAFGADQKDKFNYGNKSDVWSAGDEDVFAGMTPADWTEFNALGPNEQRAWIEARKKKLKGG
jgi:hypothetical protein